MGYRNENVFINITSIHYFIINYAVKNIITKYAFEITRGTFIIVIKN